jgi:hypothetical protein
MGSREFNASIRARVLVALASTVGSTQAYSQSTLLDQFVGKDLWKLSPLERKPLKDFVGEVPKGDLVEPEPWHVWMTHIDGRPGYIVLLGEPEILVPGGSSACIQLFDFGGKRSRSWSFQTGWRMTLVEASMQYSTELTNDVIVLTMARFVNGRDIAREYFAVNNGQLRLARLEDTKGSLVQNDYIYPNYEIGIVPEATTAEEWTSLLESKSRAEVLSALVFLGGRHIAEKERPIFRNEPRESRYATLFEELLSNPRIHELIESLTKSEDDWVRQAASLAAREPRERKLD